jgi:hypothetical protein
MIMGTPRKINDHNATTLLHPDCFDSYPVAGLSFADDMSGVES